MALKKKNSTVHRFLHVEISPAVAGAWRKFRDKKSMKRGPLEERALVEYMENHKNESAPGRPEIND